MIELETVFREGPEKDGKAHHSGQAGRGHQKHAEEVSEDVPEECFGHARGFTDFKPRIIRQFGCVEKGVGICLNPMEITPAGIGDGEDDCADASGAGILDGAGGGFQGGAGCQDVIYECDTLATEGAGVGQAECEAKIRGAVGGRIDGGLGGGVFQTDDGRGDDEGFSIARQAVGQGICLVVAAADVAGPVQRGRDQDIRLVEQFADALFGEHPVGQCFGQWPAVMIFHLVDHFSQGFAKWSEGDDLLKWMNARAVAKGAGAADGNRGRAARACGVGGEGGKGFSTGGAEF